jgi:hypothetical protein
MKLAKGLRDSPLLLASDHYNEPRWEIRQSADGKIGAVFFYMAGKQFVLLIDRNTNEEICVCFIDKNRQWKLVK